MSLILLRGTDLSFPGISPNRLNMEQLKNQLSNRKICYEGVNNKCNLVYLLENALSLENTGMDWFNRIITLDLRLIIYII